MIIAWQWVIMLLIIAFGAIRIREAFESPDPPQEQALALATPSATPEDATVPPAAPTASEGKDGVGDGDGDPAAKRTLELCGEDADCAGELGSSDAWKAVIRNDDLYKQLRELVLDKGMRPDTAILYLMQSEPAAATDFASSAYPESNTTRSVVLSSDLQAMQYDDRVRAACKFGYRVFDPTSTSESECTAGRTVELMLTNPDVRAVFQKVLMNDAFFGCLINNARIDGDVSFCFFTYFKSNPEDYTALQSALRQAALADPGPKTAQNAVPTATATASTSANATASTSTSANRCRDPETDCVVSNLTLLERPDGMYELNWQMADSKTPGAPKRFSTLEEFQRWWKFIQINNPSMRDCQRPAVSKPLQTALDASLAGPLQASQPISTTQSGQGDARFEQILADLAALKTEIHAVTMSAKTPPTSTQLEGSLEVQKAAESTAKDGQGTFGFTFVPTDKWDARPRPPVCLTEQHCPVCPMFPAETPVGLMDLPMWSKAEVTPPPPPANAVIGLPDVPELTPTSSTEPAGMPQPFNA